LSRAAAGQTKKKSAANSRTNVRGRVDRDAMLKAAFELFAREGDEGFSLRKLGVRVGVDPMTVLHHFRSREELLREVADHALASVAQPLPTDDWRFDLKAVARAYRDLARKHPRVFRLHFRFHTTGPVDHASSEVVYRAMRRAGLSDKDAAGMGLAYYAFVLGFAVSEAEGLLAPIDRETVAELAALDPLGYPATRALIPAFKSLNPDAAFDASIDAFIAGVAQRAG
jgi:AcrR family transcriptional regulator